MSATQRQVRATAYTEKQFRRLVEGIGWTLDTEHGDLCAQCARSWRDERSRA